MIESRTFSALRQRASQKRMIGGEHPAFPNSMIEQADIEGTRQTLLDKLERIAPWPRSADARDKPPNTTALQRRPS